MIYSSRVEATRRFFGEPPVGEFRERLITLQTFPEAVETAQGLFR